MKKIAALFLSICIFSTLFCSRNNTAYAEDDPYMYEYAMLTEPDEQELLENEVYDQLNNTINADGDYLIDVQTFYQSKEAIEEELYNSRETEFFGLLLSEADAEFKGTPYVFTVDDKGETVVREFVPYEDVWGGVLKNVAIGSGVILICVTVSSLTVPSAPAIHMIFAAAAKKAVTTGIKSTAIMAVKAAISKYTETGNIEEALKSAAAEGSEGFKWGAVAGAISGATGLTIRLNSLKRSTGMTTNDIAEIQTDTNFSDETIKNIRSSEEFEVYRDAGLEEYDYGGRRFLIPKDMDWNYKDPATGMTNRQLINAGYNPVDSQGKKYQLHHVGQKTNSPLALLTEEQHQSNTKILHTNNVSEVRPNGDNTYWMTDKKNALQCLSQLLDHIL